MKRFSMMIWVALAALGAVSQAFAIESGTLALRPYMQFEGPRAIPRKAAAPIVGTQIDFWVWDLTVMPPTDAQVTATCRGVSDHGYIFIEDTQWNVSMDQNDVDAILAVWDEATPANSVDPAEGVYDIETELFGEPPDVDGWPGIVLLYYDMGCFNDTCFDGFYRYDDQLATAHSNQMDMLHLAAANTDPGADYMLGVTAHEFNHMLQMVNDVDDFPWLSEALAEAAMIVTGYDTDLDWLTAFVNAPTTSFFGDEFSVHYGAALLLGTYIYEFGGVDLLQAVTADDANGADSLEEQLSTAGLGGYSAFFGDMTAAIVGDHLLSGAKTEFTDDGSGPFHYDLLDVAEPHASGTPDCDWAGACEWNASLDAGSLALWPVDLPDGSPLYVGVDRAATGIIEIALIAHRGGVLEVVRVGASEDWTEAVVDVADLDALFVVLANPTSGDSSAAVTLSLEPGGDDDDADDDVSDDDADDGGDDDAADDDDDDDDDDSGCGC